MPAHLENGEKCADSPPVHAKSHTKGLHQHMIKSSTKAPFERLMICTNSRICRIVVYEFSNSSEKTKTLNSKRRAEKQKVFRVLNAIACWAHWVNGIPKIMLEFMEILLAASIMIRRYVRA